MKTIKKLTAILAVLMLVLSGCQGALSTEQSGAQNESQSQSGGTVTSASNISDSSDMFTDRDLDASFDESESTIINFSGTEAEISGSGAEKSSSAVTITDEGTYILCGSFSGMVIVDAEKTDKIQLVLKGASITSESSAAIYVRQADKVFVTLAEGTENSLSNGGVFTAIDENNIDAAVFSKDDLTLNGSGSLAIESPAGHGIVSKDDLAITGGSYEITAGSHGLSGKDCVKIAGGSFEISSGKDGIHSENADDTSLGYVYISGGEYKITSTGDGISSSGYMRIVDGSFAILSGGGSASVSKTSGGNWRWGSQAATETDSASAKGVKAEGEMKILGGSFSLDCADDALHCGSDLSIEGGSFEIATGDDGIHSDALTAISGGVINITKSYEGIEGTNITISGGTIDLVASDDGINAAGGNDQSGFGGFGGFSGNGEAASTSGCGIDITGGTININAAGDGVDSNGYLNVTGGTTYVSGPEDSGNGALDYTTSGTISGGTFVAVGAPGMAQNFGSSSTQGTILVTTGTQSAGTEIVLKDSSGKVLVSYKSEKSFGSVVISCPEIKQGETYTVSAGSYSGEITMDSLVYGSSGGMGGMQGGFGGRGEAGTMPDGTMPDGSAGRGQHGMNGAGGTSPDMTSGATQSSPSNTAEA